MDLDMFAHPSTQKNLSILQSYGNMIIEAQTGELASGLSGQGRLEEPEKIFEIISDFFSKQQQLDKKKILITAGPTYEKIDPVRFIGNYSTGTMGFALAHEAALRGAEVILVTGPVSLVTGHPNIRRIDVESAEEMMEQCLLLTPDADILIMAAAVADYTVVSPHDRKIKKTDSVLSLELKPTVDILKALSVNKKKEQVFVGFALETDQEIENATAKLKTKNLDYIILNSLRDEGAGFGTSTNKITILNEDGIVHAGELKSKREIAGEILAVIA
jgi:phosphopantothenoylcysteine decarboxylase/phosphopantothenate--cysteine ligase